MSIINDALKKTQQHRKNGKEKSVQAIVKPVEKRAAELIRKYDRIPWKTTGIVTMTILLVILAAATYQQMRSVKYFLQPMHNTQEKVNIVLDGVFLSNNMNVALINKQTMRLGDRVNGMKIVAINLDTIKLQGENGTIELRAGATYSL